MSDTWKWYVYELHDPRTNTVFYIGKGSGQRIHAHEKQAAKGVCSKKTKIIKDITSCGLSVVKVFNSYFCDEQDAYDHETDLIDEIGLENLSNVVRGGQGAWDRRLVARKARKKKDRVYKMSISDDVVSRFAWVVKRSLFLWVDIEIKHTGKGCEILQMVSDAVVKAFGSHTKAAQRAISLMIKDHGREVVRKKFLEYDIDLDYCNGCA